MDKYRIRNLSNSKFPSTNVHLSNTTGPLYTIGGTSHHHQLGPQLFMNTPSVGTSTQFQFVPGARNFCTTSATPTSSKTIPLGIGMSIVPLFHTVKTFFVNLMKPKVDADLNNMYDPAVRCEYSSTPNIYMDMMSDSKCDDDFDKKSFVDLSNCEMMSKLSASRKSFSHYDLPVTTTTTNKNNFLPKTQKTSRKIELSCTEKSAAMPTKEHKQEDTPGLIRSTSSPILFQQKSKKNRKRKKMPNMSNKSRRECNDGSKTNRTTMGVSACKKTTKAGKNMKEKQKHELAQTIRTDTQTEMVTMSTDEWDEPIVFVSTLKKNQIDRSDNVRPKSSSFCTDEFPATRKDPMIKQQAEFPTPSSYCSLTSLTNEKQRQISECDSEDSYIVFDYDAKSIPSSTESATPSICERIRNTLSGRRWQQEQQRQISESSDDDCLDIEGSDMDYWEYDESTLESDSESELDDIDDVISWRPKPPTSGWWTEEILEKELDLEKESNKKKVHFDPKPPRMQKLLVWSFAAQQTRITGYWEVFGRDSLRFMNRVRRLEPTLLPILNPAHREKIYNERFNIDVDNENLVCAIEN